MIFYIYAIRSKNKNYIYVGITKNINDRINRHNLGREKTTKYYKPFEIIFLTVVNNRKIARQVEVYLKSGCGKEFLKTMF